MLKLIPGKLYITQKQARDVYGPSPTGGVVAVKNWAPQNASKTRRVSVPADGAILMYVGRLNGPDDARHIFLYKSTLSLWGDALDGIMEQWEKKPQPRE